jgi:site-specific DNA recombinase
MPMTEKLRFAPLIRVSTESQEKRGESLNVQRDQIKGYVDLMKGSIPEPCWKYSGQEHATVGQERAKLDQLLKDSGKDIFDAIIVCDASRWSRDNLKSKEGLEILRQNGIRFFVGTSEHDLFSPEQTLFIGLAVEIGEFYGKQQALKSMLSKISNAKKGIPSVGGVPYGRTFDRKTKTWGVDEEKKNLMIQAAKEYVEGGKAKTIAKKMGMSYSGFLNIIKDYCGDQWTISFESKRMNISEKVPMKIPRLLPDEMIQAIHKKTAANRTYLHGESKNTYLLKSMIFCNECGASLSGQTNINGSQYYRHPKNGCQPFNSIPAKIVDEAALFNLFNLFGDSAAMAQAAKDAIPDLEGIKAMQLQMSNFEKEVQQIKIKKNKIYDLVEVSGVDEDIKGRLQKHKDREMFLKEQLTDLSSRLQELPSEKDITMQTKLLHRIMESHDRSPDHLKEMSLDEKRKFFQDIFGGKDRDGKRFGVYISKFQKKNDQDGWEFKLIGNLITEKIHDKCYPLIEGEKEAIMDVPEGFFDADYDNKANIESL